MCKFCLTVYTVYKMFNLRDTPCPYDTWVATARKSCDDPDRYHCLRYPTHIAPCFCYCKQNKIKLTLIKRHFNA